ncbi:deoxyribodipyrimidine photo-lyase [Luteimonas pelagia]
MATAILWFRNDLRLADNPALKAAVDGGYAILPVYIHAPEEEGAWAPGAASDAWRAKSLASLDAALRKRGNRLRRFVGPSMATLETLVDMARADAVFWNRRYEPEVERRDAAIKRALKSRGLRVDSYNGALLFEPWEVENRSGDPYRVFTPFWKRALSQWRTPTTWDAPDALPDVRDAPSGVAPDALKLAPAARWDAGFWTHWSPGEAGAAESLDGFLGDGLDEYAGCRDVPAVDGTSRLSPHLHFGEISIRRVAARLGETADGTPAREAAIAAWLRELGWREFSHHLLHHFPDTPDTNLDPRFADFDWARAEPSRLARWRRGRTGVPIVDAGMRQLWATGWMHNRVRMIVASYLTKHMRMHWRHGARWFWDTLVDADLANNTQGWQWTAGTGADAAPYFRVFNPVLQSRRFDPDGRYLARWLPELEGLAPAQRHAPWEHRDALRRRAPGYPRQPLVGLEAGRDAALAAWNGVKR